jgi:hypothetical protein
MFQAILLSLFILYPFRLLRHFFCPPNDPLTCSQPPNLMLIVDVRSVKPDYLRELMLPPESDEYLAYKSRRVSVVGYFS